MTEGEKFTDWLVDPKGSQGLWVLGDDMTSLRIPLDLRGICSTDRTGSVSPKPLVDTLGVELVITRQDP